MALFERHAYLDGHVDILVLHQEDGDMQVSEIESPTIRTQLMKGLLFLGITTKRMVLVAHL